MGVIRGKGSPELKAPPVEDEEVLEPQLVLKLVPCHCPSSKPRTVNRRVKRSAFVASLDVDIGIKCNLVVIPLYDKGIAPYMYSVMASKSRLV